MSFHPFLSLILERIRQILGEFRTGTRVAEVNDSLSVATLSCCVIQSWDRLALFSYERNRLALISFRVFIPGCISQSPRSLL